MFNFWSFDLKLAAIPGCLDNQVLPFEWICMCLLGTPWLKSYRYGCRTKLLWLNGYVVKWISVNSFILCFSSLKESLVFWYPKGTGNWNSPRPIGNPWYNHFPFVVSTREIEPLISPSHFLLPVPRVENLRSHLQLLQLQTHNLSLLKTNFKIRSVNQTHVYFCIVSLLLLLWSSLSRKLIVNLLLSASHS